MSGSQNCFCSYCGAAIAPNDSFCNNCGKAVYEVQEQQEPQTTYQPTYAPQYQYSGPRGTQNYVPPYSQQGYPSKGYMTPRQEKASTGLVILSFLFPIVGIILAIVKSSNGQKQAAKSYIIAAVVSIIISVFLNLIPFFIGFY